MNHRIRAAALVVQDGKLLLVKHQHPETGQVWWVPPGGGIEGDESLFQCASRETFEETGLSVELDRIAYIREFVEPGYHHCEHFITCRRFSGRLTIENIVGKGIDEHFIKDVRFLSRDQISEITAYPEILKDAFWDDLANGFPTTRYLGVKKVSFNPLPLDTDSGVQRRQ